MNMNQFVFAIFILPVYSIIYGWLVLRLPRSLKGLAAILLAAQLIVLSIALFYTPASSYEQWLWDIDEEWNIASALSSAQFVIVGVTALVAGWLAKAQRRYHRFYLSGIGLLFALLAFVEFFSWKPRAFGVWHWHLPYLIMGGVAAFATVIMVETLPKRERLWLLYLLAAFILISLGGIYLDSARDKICNAAYGILWLEGCIDQDVLDEVLEMVGGWLAVVAMLGHFSDIVPNVSKRVCKALILVPAIWILAVTQIVSIPPISNQARAKSVAVLFESGAQLTAYSFSRHEREIDIHLYLTAAEIGFERLGYSIHVIDMASEESVTSVDRRMNSHLDVYVGPGRSIANHYRAQLNLPAGAPSNHALWLVMSLWRMDGDEFTPLRILSSDHQLLSATQVHLDALVLPDESPPPLPRAPIATFVNGFTLDGAALPKQVRAGETLPITFTWRADKAGREDYVQFLHIGSACRPAFGIRIS